MQGSEFAWYFCIDINQSNPIINHYWDAHCTKQRLFRF
jgi:hypothetical protein